MRLFHAKEVGSNCLPENFRMVVAGPTGAGKTSFVKQLIHSKRIKKPFKHIYYCYPDHFETPPIDWHKWDDVIVTYVPFIPDINFIKSIKQDSLLILDDNYDECIKSAAISAAFKIHSRRKFAIIIITQFYYESGQFARAIRNQLSAVVLFRNFGDASMNRKIAIQLGVKKQFDLAAKATENCKFDPIVILDGAIVSQQEMRVQTSFLHNNYSYCYK